MRLCKHLIILLSIVLLGVGCNSSHQLKGNKGLSSMRELSLEKSTYPKKGLIPLRIEEGSFHTVADWKDSETIFYIINKSDSSEVRTYNIYTGETSLFYESVSPIVQFKANEKRNLFLIHTSPSTYVAEITILDKEGNVKYRTDLESFELEFTWNHSNQDQLFITSFKEDWTFDTYILNVRDESIKTNPVSIPFIQWVNEEEFTYIKWDQNSPSLSAPLHLYNIKKQKEEVLAEHVVSNTNFSNALVTVELIGGDGSAIVKVYDLKSKQSVIEMPIQLVGLYSEWASPYHDMDVRGEKFYIFEVNSAKSAFSLVFLDVKTGKKEEIINHAENLPIKLSPDGKYALYGGRFENIISIKDKEMKELIKLKVGDE